MNKADFQRGVAGIGLATMIMALAGCQSGWEKAEREDKLEGYLECLAKDASLSATFSRIKISLIGLRKTDQPQPIDLIFGVGYGEGSDISAARPIVQLGINTNRPPAPGHVFVITAVRLQNLPRRRLMFPARLLYLSDDRDTCWWGSFWLPAGGELREGVVVTTDKKPMAPGDYIKRLPIIKWWRQRLVDGAWAGTQLELGISGIRVCAPVAGDFIIVPSLGAPAVTRLKKADYTVALDRGLAEGGGEGAPPNIVTMIFEVPTNRIDALSLHYIEQPVALLRPKQP